MKKLNKKQRIEKLVDAILTHMHKKGHITTSGLWHKIATGAN